MTHGCPGLSIIIAVDVLSYCNHVKKHAKLHINIDSTKVYAYKLLLSLMGNCIFNSTFSLQKETIDV